MTTKAKASKNTLIKRGDGGGTEVFTTIGEILSFSGMSEEVEEIEVTSFDSTAKEYISSGLADNGEITIEMNFIGSDAQQQGLRSDLRAGTTRNFTITLNDHASTPTSFAFAAVVKAFEGPNAGQAEQYKASVRLRPTGTPTVTYAPS